MLRESKVSLNVISENAAFELLQRFLDRGYQVANVYVDTVGSPQAYANKFRERFRNYNINFRVETKADSLFKVVSAASIVAKVTRDRMINDWQFRETLSIDRDYGSGYPGDAKTVAWLRRNCDPVLRLPTIARFSWATCATLAEKQCCKAHIYCSLMIVDNDHLEKIGIRVPKSFEAKVSKVQLYRNLDELVEVTGAFEL